MHDVVRFTRQAAAPRRQGALLHVMASTEPMYIEGTGRSDARLFRVGRNDRDVEVEILALVLSDELLVIHVMPTELRRTQ